MKKTKCSINPIKMNLIKINSTSSQVSFEFIMLYVFVFLIFIGLLIVFGNQLVDMKKDAENMQIKSVQNHVINEIRMAYTAESHYLRRFSVPTTIAGVDYQMFVEGELLVIYFDGREYAAKLPRHPAYGLAFYLGDEIVYERGAVDTSEKLKIFKTEDKLILFQGREEEDGEVIAGEADLDEAPQVDAGIEEDEE